VDGVALNAARREVNIAARPALSSLPAQDAGATRRNHMLRPLLLSAALGLAALGSVHAPEAQARGYVGIDVRLAPPPPRYERIVVRPGYVWTPGYWRWNGRRHVWVAGYAVPVRRGYVYAPPRWYRHGPHWRFRAGYWVPRR
jgi:hypothetical protein